MGKERKRNRSKLNVITTLMRQLMATLCGIVLPRILIGAFGSVVYGATTSIAQFLSYISLLEGGIGRVARGALYEPLARGDKEQVSRIHQAIRRFFLKIAGVFLIYTLVIAVFYHDLAGVTVFERQFTFGLVIAVSLSTMTNYLGGIADLTLMNADQKQYLSNIVVTITNVLNMLFVVVLVLADASILIVKLASAAIFVTRRIFYTGYVRSHYQLPKVPANGYKLEQRWTGMGQHIAYFLHTNTDVVLLTLFADLKLVAVYSIYHLVIRSIWDISSSFTGGMEAAFGELIARKKTDELKRSCGKYTAMLNLVTIVLFGCTGVLIIPFVRLYMAGVTDADYIQPIFALVLLLAEAINCLVLPYTTLPISANKLRQSRWGSYGEAIINVVLSVILIHWNPLLGVAIGTLAATIFKAVYYMVYTTRNILGSGLGRAAKEVVGSAVILSAVSITGMRLLWNAPMAHFGVWLLWAIVTCMCVGLIVLLLGMIVFPEYRQKILGKIYKRSLGR